MDLENNINWQRLISGISFYENSGFKYLDLDWTIPSEISQITKPVDCNDIYIDEKVLVGSGEQTFLNMMINSSLKPGRYCGITPCFRDDEIDELHNKYFMKVELIDTLNVNEDSLLNIMDICKQFFSLYIDVEIIPVVNNSNHKVIDAHTYDIIDKKYGIEVGSYGIRKYDRYQWIFATGIAEPRLNKVMMKYASYDKQKH